MQDKQFWYKQCSSCRVHATARTCLTFFCTQNVLGWPCLYHVVLLQWLSMQGRRRTSPEKEAKAAEASRDRPGSRRVASDSQGGPGDSAAAAVATVGAVPTTSVPDSAASQLGKAPGCMAVVHKSRSSAFWCVCQPSCPDKAAGVDGGTAAMRHAGIGQRAIPWIFSLHLLAAVSLTALTARAVRIHSELQTAGVRTLYPGMRPVVWQQWLLTDV